MAYRRLRSGRSAKVAAGTILVIVLLAICAPVFAAITRLGPDQQFINIGENASGGPVPPGGIFWFGTDSYGRDLFVRVLYGARISLVVGVLATAISVALGVVFGLAAGYLGGFVDSLIVRVIDVLLSIPLLLIAIFVAGPPSRRSTSRTCPSSSASWSSPRPSSSSRTSWWTSSMPCLTRVRLH